MGVDIYMCQALKKALKVPKAGTININTIFTKYHYAQYSPKASVDFKELLAKACYSSEKAELIVAIFAYVNERKDELDAALAEARYQEEQAKDRE